MGMASLVLWWIDDPAASREAIVDAMTRVWLGVLILLRSNPAGRISSRGPMAGRVGGD